MSWKASKRCPDGGPKRGPVHGRGWRNARFGLLLAAPLLLACGDQPRAPIEHSAPTPPAPLRIAFGSCNDLTEPQVLWDPLVSLSPDLFIWLGDIVYADTEDPVRMRALYDETRAYPGYARLRRTTTVVGTWDDHDYGGDNLGREYPMRETSQRLLLDFLDEPADSPRRKQAGVYAAYDYGRADSRVRVILLDTRYHREAPGPEADILGEAQWRWLRGQLTASPAQVHIVASSIQVIAEDHEFEKWANFPAARRRLLELLRQSEARNIVLISGDRHYAELSRLPAADGSPALYDLTSSSLSRPWQKPPAERNRHRVGKLYHPVNFGLIEVDWGRAQLSLQVRGADNRAHIEERIPLSL